MSARAAVLAAAALLVAAPSARALDAFAGYSSLRLHGDDVRGAGLSAAWGTGALRLVGEVTAQLGQARGEDVREWTVMAGPAYSLRRGRRLSPFVQARVGGVHSRRQVEVFGVAIGPDGPCDGACPARSGLLAEGGAGLDIALKPRWALRLPQADYRVARLGGATERGLRLSAGVVFRPGR